MEMWSESIDRRKTCFRIGNLIPCVDSLIKDEGPKVGCCGLMPVHYKVNHYGAWHIKCCLNITFNQDLMLFSYAREMTKLTLILNISLPLDTTKRMIVGQVLLDRYATSLTKGFESMFGLDGFSCSGRKLMLIKDKSRCMIDKDGSTGVLFNLSLFTKRSTESKLFRRNIKIDWNTASWNENILTHSVKSVYSCSLERRCCSFLLSKLATCTEWKKATRAFVILRSNNTYTCIRNKWCSCMGLGKKTLNILIQCGQVGSAIVKALVVQDLDSNFASKRPLHE